MLRPHHHALRSICEKNTVFMRMLKCDDIILSLSKLRQGFYNCHGRN